MATKKNKEKKTHQIGWDHPFVAMGFLPEHLLLEVWPYSETYWKDFLEKNCLRWRTLAEGVRWFHISQLESWFCNGGWNADPPPESTDNAS